MIKVTFQIFLSLVVLSASVAWSQETIDVSNEVELAEAIGSNRVINLAPGVYDLNALVERAGRGEAVGSEAHVQYVSMWGQPAFVITDVENMQLNGPVQPGETAHLLMNDATMNVIWFVRAQNVVIENVLAGHGTEVGACSGNVFSVSDSTGFTVRHSELYGSGSTGIQMNDSEITLESVEIHDCSSLLLEAFGGVLRVSDSVINHQSRAAFEFYSTQVLFERTSINFTGGDGDVFRISGTGHVSVVDSVINSTGARCLTDNSESVSVFGSTLEGVTDCSQTAESTDAFEDESILPDHGAPLVDELDSVALGTGSGTTEVSVRRGSPSVVGFLTREQIERVVRRHGRGLRYCYERELGDNPTLEGSVTLQWTINLDGEVSESQISSSDLSNVEAEACLLLEVNRMRFPEPDGGVVVVTYPFVFQLAE